MKIRSDFVTNSSSSSFILGFSSKENVVSELERGFPKHHIEKIGTVLKDIFAADEMDRESVINAIRDECYYDAVGMVERRYRRDTGCSWTESYGYAKTEEGKRKVEKLLNDLVNDAMTKIEANNFFVELTYSDNDGEYFSELEHDVMPDVDTTIVTINNH